jgi:hypothetical protein
MSAATTSGLVADNAWYMDLGATDHITGELDRLTMHEPYTGRIRLTQPMA